MDKHRWITDICFLPFVYPAGYLLRRIREKGLPYLPFCKKALMKVGVFPIRDHYYEPLFNTDHFHDAPPRRLPGIDLNVGEQLKLLESFHFTEELKDVPAEKTDDLGFYMNNVAFESGDAEYWYNLIRLKKPRRIFEIGSGHSTRMARRAIAKNQEEDPAYKCHHVCVEPYEAPWLEQMGVSVIRKKVEEMDLSFFSQLAEDDILFIDSTHVIRPRGDVLFEYLQVLPSLSKGVIVHIHDIFTPNDYPDYWIQKIVLFWNEQYLLEAMLSSNKAWRIIGAVNFLRHNHFEKLAAKCPFLKADKDPNRGPGSFYIQKNL